MNKFRFSLLVAVIVLGTYGGYRFAGKYYKDDQMIIPIEELTATDYPQDPSRRSSHYGQYVKRKLNLVKKDDRHFDFTLVSSDPDVATISFKNIDMSLLIPLAPKWAKADFDLETITLVEREWNRQQFWFDQSSPQLEIQGGDGYEKKNLFSAELSRNCLNAGLWEVLLYTKSDGKKQLYYHGWFTFPLGHYKELFEKLNDRSYWSHWFRLEHWFDPAGKTVDLAKLRDIAQSSEVRVLTNPNEPLLIKGEQERKRRILSAMGIKCFGDVCEHESLEFASFLPPGRYDTKAPKSHELNRIKKVEHAIVRKVKSVADGQMYDEIELVFRDPKSDEVSRFIVSGIDIKKIPKLPKSEYPQGLYMPMGIAVPPFYQSYKELKASPPKDSVYFSVLLDRDGKWLNHHDIGIDGPIIHRDLNKSDLIHLYFLSYERLMLVGHYVIQVPHGSFLTAR